MLAVLIPLVIVIGVGVFWYVQKNPLDATSSSASLTNTSAVQNTQQVSDKTNGTPQAKVEQTSPQKAEHPLAILDKQRVKDMYIVQAAIEAYKTDHGAYPTTGGYPIIIGLSEFTCLNVDGFGPAGCADPYLAVVPHDPGLLAYQYNSTGDEYLLQFALDGKSEQFPDGEGIYILTEAGIEASSIVQYVAEPGDSDGDQLSDADETAVGWDPNNADTDGDGFSDMVEVMNGYNPNGDGELPNGALIRQMFMSAMPTSLY